MAVGENVQLVKLIFCLSLICCVDAKETCRSWCFAQRVNCFQSTEGWEHTECTVLGANVLGRPWTLQDTPLP